MNIVQHIIVDGYNVINAWPKLKKLSLIDFEEARYKLIDMLHDYASVKGINVEVVFDAHYVKGSIEKKEKDKNINIVFTKEGESADCYIERTVVALSKKVKVAVVTSDYIEQKIVLQMGGIRITPKEFYAEVKRSGVEIKKKTSLEFSETRNTLEHYVDDKTLEKLERIRRNL